MGTVTERDLTAAEGAQPIYGRDLPEQPPGTRLRLRCPSCDQDFVWEWEESHPRPLTFCSRACRNRRHAHNAERQRFAVDQLPADVDDVRLLMCSHCGEPFGWAPFPGATDDAPPLYCTLKCTRRARALRELARRDAADPDRIRRRAEVAENTAVRARRRAEEAERRGRRTEAAQIRAKLAQQAREQADTPSPGLVLQAEAARELLLPGTHCRCGKVACATKEIAKETKRAIERRAGHSNEVRYYQCYEPDGPWHWTRLDATLDGWKRRQRR